MTGYFSNRSFANLIVAQEATAAQDTYHVMVLSPLVFFSKICWQKELLDDTSEGCPLDFSLCNMVRQIGTAETILETPLVTSTECFLMSKWA
nr:hypothetical protein [Salmonid herpesvirus 1]